MFNITEAKMVIADAVINMSGNFVMADEALEVWKRLKTVEHDAFSEAYSNNKDAKLVTRALTNLRHDYKAWLKEKELIDETDC